MLTTLANFRESIDAQTTANDTYYNNILNRATSLIERVIVGRVLEEQELVQFYDGSGANHLNLSDGPLVSVSSVALVSYDDSRSPTIEETVNPGDYFLVGERDRNWKLPGYLSANGGWNWIAGDQNYQVTYTVGFTTGSIPADLEHATILAATFFLNRRKDVATTSRDIGEGAISYRTEQDLMNDLHTMLMPYKSLRY